MPSRHQIGTTAEIPEGGGKAFSVAGRKVAVFKVGGRLYAIDDVCSHEGASLAEGTLDGTKVVCPWHAAEFDLKTGEVLCPPASENVGSYPVFVTGDSIEVEI